MTMSLGRTVGLSRRTLRPRTHGGLVRKASLRWLVPAVKIAGGIVLILFATVLFLTVIPISANGDYIAAGC
jgi:hypothetical protein